MTVRLVTAGTGEESLAPIPRTAPAVRVRFRAAERARVDRKPFAMPTTPVLANPSWSEADLDDADLASLLRLLFADQHATRDEVAA